MTSAAAGIYRTPQGRFDDLPGFPFEPHYRQWQEMRLAHLDEGDGSPIVMLHGEPTWSFLYRKVMGPLLDAGYRCIAPDLPGFGRSDKPLDIGWYSYDHHVTAVAALLEDLDLRDVTTPRSDRVTRLVAMDTLVLTGEQELGDSWRWFRDLVASRDDLPVGRIVRMG